MTERWFSDAPDALEAHGRDGTMQIESPGFTKRIYPLTKTTEDAWADIGVKKLPRVDLNAGNNLGLAELNENRSKGARQIAPAVVSIAKISLYGKSTIDLTFSSIPSTELLYRPTRSCSPSS